MSTSRVVAQEPLKAHENKIIFSDTVTFYLFQVSDLDTQMTIHVLKYSPLRPIQASDEYLSYLHKAVLQKKHAFLQQQLKTGWHTILHLKCLQKPLLTYLTFASLDSKHGNIQDFKKGITTTSILRKDSSPSRSEVSRHFVFHYQMSH